MERAALSSVTDLAGWRAAARDLLTRDVPPEMVEWTTGAELGGIFADDKGGAASGTSGDAARLTVPRAFIELASTAILHRDPQRFALLYRLLWRLRDERGLLSVAVDPDVARANAMANGVRRDVHKMKAFVRFREIHADGPLYIAWFEPSHYIVEATAPFFARRFANRRWSILTPEASVHWDGAHLEMAPGAARADAPGDDELEALWRTYYASIFNPARLRIAAMRSEMPKKYWRNLPEAELIAPLIATARQRTQQMIDARGTVPRRHRRAEGSAAQAEGHPRIDALAPGASLADVRDAAAHCRDCPLWKPATQTVFGEGAGDARVMLVGEQAGDQEDFVGRPFVGPAGKLLDRALAAAGIDRSALYVTNAVKHFKFEPRGKRRIHKKPADAEIDACYRWLEREMALVRPALIVALGATAARALTGRAMAVGVNRGHITDLPDGTKLMITVHPSYLLRVPEENHQAEHERFVADLAHVAEYLATLRDAASTSRPPQPIRSDELPRSNRNP